MERIVAETFRLLDDPDAHAAMARPVNPYGDGQAAERIVSALIPPAPFSPSFDQAQDKSWEKGEALLPFPIPGLGEGRGRGMGEGKADT